MNRVILIVVAGFAVAFAAGGSVGLLAGSEEGLGASREPGLGLDRELGLTPAQREQMRSIWSEVLDGGGRELRQRREDLWRRRTEAFEALLNEPQRRQYDQTLAEYQRGMEQIDQEWRELVSRAVDRTRGALTPEQAQRYEEIRRQRLLGGRGFGPPPPGGPRPHGPRGMPGDWRPPYGPTHKGRGPFSRPGREIDGPPRRPPYPQAPNSPEP